MALRPSAMALWPYHIVWHSKRNRFSYISFGGLLGRVTSWWQGPSHWTTKTGMVLHGISVSSNCRAIGKLLVGGVSGLTYKVMRSWLQGEGFSSTAKGSTPMLQCLWYKAEKELKQWAEEATMVHRLSIGSARTAASDKTDFRSTCRTGYDLHSACNMKPSVGTGAMWQPQRKSFGTSVSPGGSVFKHPSGFDAPFTLSSGQSSQMQSMKVMTSLL